MWGAIFSAIAEAGKKKIQDQLTGGFVDAVTGKKGSADTGAEGGEGEQKSEPEDLSGADKFASIAKRVGDVEARATNARKMAEERAANARKMAEEMRGDVGSPQPANIPLKLQPQRNLEAYSRRKPRRRLGRFGSRYRGQ